jgi:hypothetical protein
MDRPIDNDQPDPNNDNHFFDVRGLSDVTINYDC